MKTQKTFAYLSATLALAFAGSAFAQEATYADVAPPTVDTAVSRAEIEADRNLWLKSGMSIYSGNQSADASVAGYVASVSAYRAARNGPAYLAELRRVQGDAGAAVASGPTSGIKAE
jgi:hypothetical protein